MLAEEGIMDIVPTRYGDTHDREKARDAVKAHCLDFPAPEPEPIVRFETAPGHQAQMDRGEYRLNRQRIYAFRDGEIADLLNERGVRTVATTPWTAARISRLRKIYQLTDRRTRLLAQGLLTPEDVATRYDVVPSTAHLWRRRGLLQAHPVNDRGDYLYEIPLERAEACLIAAGSTNADASIARINSSRF